MFALGALGFRTNSSCTPRIRVVPVVVKSTAARAGKGRCRLLEQVHGEGFTVALRVWKDV